VKSELLSTTTGTCIPDNCRLNSTLITNTKSHRLQEIWWYDSQ